LILLSALIGFGAQGASRPAQAGETIPGPVLATVLRIVDGDTIEVRARIWLGHTIDVMVRLDGVDTPEYRGRCEREKELAHQAAEFVRQIVADSGQRVVLENIRFGKYSRRVIARVTCPGGGDLGSRLLRSGLAHAYSGRGARPGWCGIWGAGQ